MIVDGIDERVSVLERPRPDAPGWDWKVEYTGSLTHVGRRFPDEESARSYARELTKIHASDPDEYPYPQLEDPIG